MKAIFLGRARPYARKAERGGGMVYGAFFAFPDAQEAGTITDPMRFSVAGGALDSQLAAVEIGTMLEVEAQPRMFAGQIQGFDLQGVIG